MPKSDHTDASGNQSFSIRLAVPTVSTPPSSTQSITDANPVRPSAARRIATQPRA